jgi:hypothetical protein
MAGILGVHIQLQLDMRVQLILKRFLFKKLEILAPLIGIFRTSLAPSDIFYARLSSCAEFPSMHRRFRVFGIHCREAFAFA